MGDLRENKLVLLVKTLSVSEIRNFKRFLYVVSDKQQPNLDQLFDQILKAVITKNKAFPTKEKMHQLAFPKKKFVDVNFRQQLFVLQSAMLDFLAFQKLQQNESLKNLMELNILRERQLDKHFDKKLKAIRKNQNNKPLRNSDYFLYNYLEDQEEFLKSLSKPRSKTVNLQTQAANLEVYFIINKLRLVCHMVSHENVFKIEYDKGMLAETLDYINRQQLLENPIINLYYNCYKSLTETEDISYFSEGKKLLVEHMPLLRKAEIGELYLLLLNYCIRAINEGKEHFIQEAFELYKLGIHQKFLINDKVISQWTYRNVVTSGLRLKESEWVFDFIQNYKPFLEKEHREINFQYCLAKYYHFKGDYQQAKKLLLNLRFKDQISELAVRILLLKTYYENQDFDLLDALIDSLLVYLRRRKLLSYHKENYYNIIKAVQKLNTHNFYDKAAQAKLKEEIEGMQPLTERVWLLEMLGRER